MFTTQLDLHRWEGAAVDHTVLSRTVADTYDTQVCWNPSPLAPLCGRGLTATWHSLIASA